MTGVDAKHYALQLIERVKAIMLSPSSEWRMIEKEPSTLAGLLLRYVAILAAIPEIAHLIGRQVEQLREDTPAKLNADLGDVLLPGFREPRPSRLDSEAIVFRHEYRS